MRQVSPQYLLTLLAAVIGLAWTASTTNAAPPFAAATPTADALAVADAAARIDVRHRRYRSFKDDYDYDYDEAPQVYYPPPEPRRYYRVPPLPDRVIEYRRPLPPPAIMYYEPPVYGWYTPPRPSSCGKYRYWDGEFCRDARYAPPYVGPRW